VESKLDSGRLAASFAALLDASMAVSRHAQSTSRFGAGSTAWPTSSIRRGAGADPVFLGPARVEVGGLDVALVFAICAALRLARFNVMIDDPQQALAGNFFTAFRRRRRHDVLLPIYLYYFGSPTARHDLADFFYTLGIALLMCRGWPVFRQARRHACRPRWVAAIVACVLVSRAHQLSRGSADLRRRGYLACLHFGWFSYRTISARISRTRAASAPPPPSETPLRPNRPAWTGIVIRPARAAE